MSSREFPGAGSREQGAGSRMKAGISTWIKIRSKRINATFFLYKIIYCM
jgi:hypothetical protein